MMKYMSGMLDAILAAKMKAEKKLQKMGSAWAKHTKNMQDKHDRGEWTPMG